MSQPDLFVVCKNCGSEVSPYVTECPYCGQRVRKRAPKIDRTPRDPEAEPRRRARSRPRLPRLRSGEIEGIAPETRPVVTLALIAISLAFTIVIATGEVALDELGGILVPAREEPWRWAISPFIHDDLGYQFVTLVATGIFGTLIERRFGWFPVLAVFLLAGLAGSAAAVYAEIPPLLTDDALFLVLGANGSALGLLCAWLVDDRRAGRRGQGRDSDMLGVAVIAAVLVLLSLAVYEANIVAAAAGALTGALLGLALPVFTRRG